MIIDGIYFNNPENDMVVKGLMAKNWENKTRDVWVNIVKTLTPDDVIWDVGAYTGYYAMLTASLVKNKIYCFEPLKSNFEVLMKNINSNKFYNIKAFDFALSDTNSEGFLKITNDIKNPSGSSLVDNGKKIKKTFPVKIRRADALDIEPPSLIKLDVEGAESKIIHGMIEIIKTSKPTMFIEILSIEEFELIQKVLSEVGYIIFRIDDINNSVEKICKSFKASNYIAVHDSKIKIMGISEN